MRILDGGPNWYAVPISPGMNILKDPAGDPALMEFDEVRPPAAPPPTKPTPNHQ